MKGLLIISGLGLLAMLAEIFKVKKIILPLTLLGIVLALLTNYLEWQNPYSIPYFDNMIFFDRPALAFSAIILCTAFFWFIMSNDYFNEDTNVADHFSLVLFALVGALMLTAFKNMTTLFLGVEIMSIPLYVLAASKKGDIKSNEAGFKYLIMGSFASAVLLFGIALIYGATGSFNIAEISTYLSNNEGNVPKFFHVGVIFMLMAFLFKVSAAPFHFWAPDVYEGSPTLVTALMSTVVKTAAFAAIFKLFMLAFAASSPVWASTLALVIALSLIISNFTAAAQSSVKRMLAYSSISHAAFMLMVVLANVRSNSSLDALVYYSLAYCGGSIIAFATLHVLASNGGDESFGAFNGLSKRNPLLAFFMALAMLSLAGIPVTAGFFGKYFVFTNMIGTPYKWLLILAVLTSGVGVYYYMKVIIAMYFKNADQDSAVDIKMPVKLTIIAAGIVTLFVGVVPGLVAQIFKF
jgi:NADH-quinone oxidoreductase subunit N